MRTKIALLAAIILGLLAAIGVRSYITRTEIDYQQKGMKATIALARETLNVGDILKPVNVREVDVDVVAVTDSHILASELKQFYDRKVTRKVPANQPLLKAYFMAPDVEYEFATKRIDSGMRAVTIGTDQIAGVAGLIIPGSRVDLLGTFRTKSRGPESGDDIKTMLVARNIAVLAVDNRMDVRIPVRGGRQAEVDRGYSSITLHVTPLEASLLIFAQSIGKITFTLRNLGDDKGIGNVPPITPTTFDQAIAEAGRRREEKIEGRPTPVIEKPPATPTN
jgi:pilus assembly protein CpaB